MKIILKKIRTKIERRIENRRKNYLHQDNILNVNFDKRTNRNDLSKTVASLLESHKSTSFLFNISDRDKIINRITTEFTSQVAKDIEVADRICKHEIPILGCGFIDVGSSINWHKDFISGAVWKPNHYTKIDILKSGEPADVKIPWELSRMHHLAHLGKVFFITQDTKYSEEFKKQILDWIYQNPPLYGINWTCTIEVALRSINLIASLCFFFNNIKKDTIFLKTLVVTLFNHGMFISKNLENNGPSPNNHYIANLAGLICLSTIFPEFKESSKWYYFAKKELENEMDRQVENDGSYYENSIPYHEFVTELFLLSSILILNKESKIKNDWYRIEHGSGLFSTNYINKLRKMVDFIVHYTKPNGSAPQIGDNDSGRVLPISNYSNHSECDHRHLLALAGGLFDNDLYRSLAENQYEDALWLLKGMYKKKDDSGIRTKSKGFNDIGIYVMRHGNNYSVIKCGKNGTNGIGTHTHNDMLSFELSIGDHDIIVDPGTFTYNRDPEMRNLFRSTSYHNTAKIDNEEINRFDKNNMFRLNNDASPKIVEWKPGEDLDIFEGEHDGYSRLAQPVVHRRRVEFHKKAGEWTVIDKFLGAGAHTLEFNLHFGTGLLVFQENSSIKVNDGIIDILEISFEEDIQLEISRYNFSRSYGSLEESIKVTYTLQHALPIATQFTIKKLGSCEI